MSTNNIHFQDKIIDIKLSQLYYNISSYGNKRFPRTQKRVRNSRGKRAISVRATGCTVFRSVSAYYFGLTS